MDDAPPIMAGQYCLLRLVNQYGVLTERLGGCLQNSLCLKELEGFDSPTRLLTKLLSYGVIGNTTVSGTVILGSNPSRAAA